MATENNAIALIAHREFRKRYCYLICCRKLWNVSRTRSVSGMGAIRVDACWLIAAWVCVCVECVNFISFAYNDADFIAMMMIMAFSISGQNCVNNSIFSSSHSRLRVSPNGSLPYLSPNSNRDSIEFGVIHHTTLLLVVSVGSRTIKLENEILKCVNVFLLISLVHSVARARVRSCARISIDACHDDDTLSHLNYRNIFVASLANLRHQHKECPKINFSALFFRHTFFAISPGESMLSFCQPLTVRVRCHSDLVESDRVYRLCMSRFDDAIYVLHIKNQIRTRKRNSEK